MTITNQYKMFLVSIMCFQHSDTCHRGTGHHLKREGRGRETDSLVHVNSPVEMPVLTRKKMETMDRAMVKGLPTRLSAIILYVDHRSRRELRKLKANSHSEILCGRHVQLIITMLV